MLVYLPAIVVAALCGYTHHNPSPFLVATAATGAADVARQVLPIRPLAWVDAARAAIHANLAAVLIACGWWAAQ